MESKKRNFICLIQIWKQMQFPYLINLLKEFSINKQLIEETIVKMGIEGENALLLMMNSDPDNNYKLKTAVIRVFLCRYYFSQYRFHFRIYF